MRYGKVIIASDYDVDGFHIKGLIINLFTIMWPELLCNNKEGGGLLYEFISPIVMADNIEFFSEFDYQ